MVQLPTTCNAPSSGNWRWRPQFRFIVRKRVYFWLYAGQQNNFKSYIYISKIAARLITDTDTKPGDHITPVLMHLHWLPIKSRILYKLYLLMHLIHTNQRPAYMIEIVKLIATCSSWSGLRPAMQSPPVPALRTKFGERAFSHASPAAWNSLPEYIQSESNTKLFKKLLKTYLFTLLF